MWSLDWFAAEALAVGGKAVRRAGWTDRWLVFYGSLWWIVTATSSRVVTTEDFSENEFLARDWTDQSVQTNQCGATPAFNVKPPVYHEWSTDTPNFLPPTVPGFVSEV